MQTNNRKKLNIYESIDEKNHSIKIMRKGVEIKVLFDYEDLDKLKVFQWHVTNNGYACTHIKKEDGKFSLLSMHRILLGIGFHFSHKLHVDHINHDKLDNRKQNLRICSAFINTCNKKNNKSGHPGVYFSNKRGVYVSQIYHDGKRIHLGQSKSIDEAISIRKKGEVLYHGKEVQNIAVSFK